jgi:tetratricopeptide (TPR) repeat protein
MAGCVLSLALATAFLGQLPAAPPPTAKEIDAAVQRLGDDSFTIRERATEELWQMGEVAEPALRAALKGTDPEIRVRAGAVLDRFKVGIFPDTSPESAELIRQYRSGQPGQKISIIQQLKAREDWRTLVRLQTGETDANLRDQITAAMRGEVIKKATACIESDDLAQAEQLLRSDNFAGDMLMHRALVTLYVVQNKLDERITELEDEIKRAPHPNKQRLYVVLCEAAGKKIDAGPANVEAAPGMAPTAFSYLVLRHNWKEAAARYDEMIAKGEARFDQLAYSSMYHRLAGNQPTANERLEQAKKATIPTQAWQMLELLLLHERVDEALEGLKTTRPSMAFEILAVRQEFEKAFAIANVKPGQTYDAAWFDALPVGDAPEADASQAINRRHILALQAAFFLHQIGEEKEAQAIFNHLRSLGKTTGDASAPWRRTELCRIQLRLGLDEQAFADGAEFMEASVMPTMINTLFARQGAIAARWYEFLTTQQPDQTPGERLQTIRRLLRPTAAQKQATDYQPLIDAAMASLPAEKGAPRFMRIETIADVYLAHGKRKETIDLLGLPDLSAALYLRRGDFLRDGGRHEEASAQYALITPGEAHRTLALYLQGVAETTAGRAEAGRRLKDKAILLSIDNPTRILLFEGMRSRQLIEEVTALRKLWTRTSPDLGNALAKEFGDSAAADDPATAVKYWEQVLVRLAGTGANLSEDAAYVTLPHLMHRTRAKAALAAGNKAEFQREMAACLRLLPSDWGALDDLIPKLDEAGWKEEADKLFSDQLTHLHALTKQYPRSARFSNAVAWVSGTCKRNLDEALVAAQRTMELSPNNPNYLDTLAEVHHARGEHAEAIATQRRVVEMSPQPLFRERLKRFEEAAGNKAGE